MESRSIKHYLDEVMNAYAEIQKKFFGLAPENMTPIQDQNDLEALANYLIQGYLEKTWNKISEKLSKETLNYLQSLKSSNVAEWHNFKKKIFFEESDLPNEYTIIHKTIILEDYYQKICEFIDEKTTFEELPFIESFDDNLFQLIDFTFDRVVFYNIIDGKLFLCLGIQFEEDFELLKQFIDKMIDLFSASLGYKISKNIEKDLIKNNDFKQATQYSYGFAKIIKEKIWENSKVPIYYDTISYHLKDSIDYLQTISKFPIISPSADKKEITGEYKELGNDIKAIIGDKSTPYFALLFVYAERSKELRFGNDVEKRDFATEQGFNGDTFYNHYYLKLRRNEFRARQLRLKEFKEKGGYELFKKYPKLEIEANKDLKQNISTLI